MRQLLTSCELDFTIAENGKQAMDYLKNEPSFFLFYFLKFLD